MVRQELPADIGKGFGRFVKTIVRRVYASGRVLRPWCFTRRLRRPAANSVVSLAGNDFQTHFKRVLPAFVWKNQGGIEIQILQEKRLVAVLFPGNGPGKLQVSGRREDDFAVHLMIAKVWKLVNVQGNV